MTTVGALKFGAKIENGDEALQTVKTLKAEFSELSGTATKAAAQMDDAADNANDLGNASDEAQGRTSGLSTAMRLLQSATLGASAMLSSFVGLLVGGGGSAAVAAASSVGLVGAAVAAVAAIGLLAGELSGLTNVTPVARREMTGLSGAFIDLAMIVTSPLIVSLGILEGYLAGGIPGAAQASKNALNELVKIAARTGTRLGALAFQAGSYVAQLLANIVSLTVNHITGLVNRGIGLLNKLIKKYNKKAGKLPGIGDDAQISTIGKLKNPSLQQRFANNAKKSRQFRQHVTRTKKEALQQYRPLPIAPNKRRRTKARRNDQQVKGIETIEVTVNNTNKGDMTRREARDLAREISKQIGVEINGLR